MSRNRRPFAIFLNVQSPDGHYTVLKRVYRQKPYDGQIVMEEEVLGRFDRDEAAASDICRDNAERDYYGINLNGAGAKK